VEKCGAGQATDYNKTHAHYILNTEGCTHAHTHARTHTHTCAHTHAHAHTHTRMCNTY